MTYLYVLEVIVQPFVLVVVVWIVSRLLSSERREHHRREALILNQLLHASGKPWQPAPAEIRTDVPDFVPEDFAVSPEQLPVE